MISRVRTRRRRLVDRPGDCLAVLDWSCSLEHARTSQGPNSLERLGPSALSSAAGFVGLALGDSNVYGAAGDCECTVCMTFTDFTTRASRGPRWLEWFTLLTPIWAAGIVDI